MNLEDFATFFFELCQNRGYTTDVIISKISDKLDRVPVGSEVESLIRNYRSNGKDLEGTARKILESFGESIIVSGNSCIQSEFDETIAWRAPKDPGKWSDADIVMSLIETYTGEDLFVNCLKRLDCGNFEYEDTYFHVRVDLFSLENIYEIAGRELLEYVYQCPEEVAFYGLTGTKEMGLEQLVETAFGCDCRWQELPNDKGILVFQDI